MLNALIGRTAPTMPILAADVVDWPNLPVAIRDKLQSLHEVRADRHTLLLRCMDESQDSRLEMQQAERRVRELHHRHHELPDDHPSLVQAKDVIARCSAAITRLDARMAELSPAWAEAGRLVDNLEKYLREHSRGEIRMFTGAAPQLLKNENPIAGLERAARRARALMADRVETMARPFPSAIAKTVAREQIARQIEGARPDVSGVVDRLEPVQFRISGLPIEQLGLDGVTRVDPVGMMAWLFPKEFIAAIDREIDAESDDKIALSAEQRIAKLKTIDADILASEREESAFADLAGLLPRPDLDPRAVLNLADDMPGQNR